MDAVRRFYKGATLPGVLGQSLALTDLTLTNNWFDWVTLTNLVFPSSPYGFIDWSSPSTSQRFYRAVRLP